MPFWQNVVIQLFSQAVFWAVLIIGIICGIGVVLSFALGVAFALLITVAPGWFVKLEVVAKNNKK
jgi:hypothetical protein